MNRDDSEITAPRPVASPRTNSSLDVARSKWYYSRLSSYAFLLLLYPVGLILAIRSPRLTRIEKIVGGLWPVWVAGILLLLKPYWDFYGDMGLFSFRLDFGKGASHYDDLEASREQQSTERAQTTVSPADMDLTWLAFRGEKRDGVVEGETISLDWEKSPPREIWRHPVGEGYASFVLARGRLYTIEQRRDKEAIVCYNFATGRELWKHEYTALFSETLGGDGPRATPTLVITKRTEIGPDLFSDQPMAVGVLVFSLGAVGDLYCVEDKGASPLVRWKYNILKEFEAENLGWALSSSPLLTDGKVIVTNSGVGGGSLIAYQASTGELAWNNDLGQQGYSSPMVVELCGKRQVLNFAGSHLNSVEPTTGKLIWQFPWNTAFGNNIAQPVLAGNDRIFLSSGYGKGCGLVQVEKKDDKLVARELWSNLGMKNKFTSSVIHKGSIYGLDEKILKCLDLDTGEKKWNGGRYGHGSVLLVGDHLLALSEEGLLSLVKATPEAFKEIATLQILTGRTWNNFILVGGRLIARNHKEMVCYDLRPEKIN